MLSLGWRPNSPRRWLMSSPSAGQPGRLTYDCRLGRAPALWPDCSLLAKQRTATAAAVQGVAGPATHPHRRMAHLASSGVHLVDPSPRRAPREPSTCLPDDRFDFPPARGAAIALATRGSSAAADGWRVLGDESGHSVGRRPVVAVVRKQLPTALSWAGTRWLLRPKHSHAASGGLAARFGRTRQWSCVCWTGDPEQAPRA
jgi:hypothetical protein